MYIAPGQGQTAPRGKKFQQKGLITLPICCKFQRNVFKSDFIHFLSMIQDSIHAYSPGTEDIQPSGDKVLISTGTSCHFGHLLLVSNHRRQ